VPPTDPTRQKVDVDAEHCHLYAICMQEAPSVFELRDDGRLHYPKRPRPEDAERVRQAARMCPTHAIRVKES